MVFPAPLVPMRKRNSLLTAGTTETFPISQAREYFFVGDVRTILAKQLAQNFEAMFFASRLRIAKNAVRLDKGTQNHDVGRICIE